MPPALPCPALLHPALPPPIPLPRQAYPGCNAPLSRYLVVAPRCYCLLTHHPFFALHFRVRRRLSLVTARNSGRFACTLWVDSRAAHLFCTAPFCLSHACVLP